MPVLLALIFIWFFGISLVNSGLIHVCPNTLNWAYFGFMNFLFVILLTLLIMRAKKQKTDSEEAGGISKLLKLPEWIVFFILLLVYQVSFLMHLNTVHDYLIQLSPSFFNRVYDRLFHYSNILSSTLLMTIANISSCMILLLLSWALIRVKDKPESLLFERVANSRFAFWLIILFAFGFNYFWAVLRHSTFNSKAWDLAIFAQLIHNFRNGVFFEAKVRGVENIFSDHFNPIIYIFSPMLYIWDDPSRLLLAMQALFIAIGAIPVYLLAKYKTESKKTGFLTTAAYLCLPTLQYMNIFDFHPVVVSIPLILFTWYFWEVRRFSLMYLFLALTLLCDEQMWIIVGAMGLFMAFQPDNRKRGLIIAGIGWLGFLLLILVFFPLFREGEAYFYVHRYAYLGDSFGEILINMVAKPWLWIPKLVSPRAISFLILLLMPVGFLALRAPKYLLILIPTYIYSVLSIEPLQTSIFAQYAAPYVPFVMIATIYALASFKDKQSIAVYLLFSALICNLFFSPLVFSKAYRSQLFEYHKIDIAPIRGYLQSLPSDAAISSVSRFAPHLIRRDLYLFPDYDDAEYIVIDLSDNHDPVFRSHFDELYTRRGYVSSYHNPPRIVLRKVSSDDFWPSKDYSLHKAYNCFSKMEATSDAPVTFEKLFVSDTVYEEEKGSMPVILRKGFPNYFPPYSREIIMDFEKSLHTEDRYFGVLVYPFQSDTYFMDNLPDHFLIRFWQGFHSDSGWEVGESYCTSVRVRNLRTLINQLPIFILMEIPDDYPNTLDEYFREYIIENRINLNEIKNLKSREELFVQSLKWYEINN